MDLITKDRTWRGTDHAASLEPTGLAKLVRNLHQTHEAMSYKERDILDIEKVQRDKLKYRKE
jgi:sialic acid synthase